MAQAADASHQHFPDGPHERPRPASPSTTVSILRSRSSGLAWGACPTRSKPLTSGADRKGYADAAEWVYSRATDRGGWTTEDLLSIAEVRRVHEMAMTPVWDVAPHPHAMGNEAPGSFREHDIEPFPGGMSPPSWVDVAPLR